MRNKQTVFWAIFIVLILMLTDTLLYLGLSFISKKKNIFYGQTRINATKVAMWRENSFDPVLGWKLHRVEANNLGARRNTDYDLKPGYDIKTFGDSFTMGAEVATDNTYQAFIEQQTGWDCLNFGVGAYGPDQALLSYKGMDIKSKYVVLGILSENIGRVVSHYPSWYMREWFPPKPRFAQVNGEMELIETPITRKKKAQQLLDDAFIDDLRKFDYWPDFYENKLKAPANLHWPAFYTILGHLPFFTSRAKIVIDNRTDPTFDSEKQKYKYTHLYESETEALQIIRYIIDSFAQTAEERGEIPVFILFADQFSIDMYKNYGKKIYEPLAAHLKQRNYHFLDIGDIFSKDDYEKYFLYYNSHYSPAGNQKVAQSLVGLIKNLNGVQSTLKMSN